MTRPPGDTRQRLIKAGREILDEHGFSGLSVRAVAARAGVNLGLVSYHFGGKKAFAHQVALEFYEEFFRDFNLQVESESAPLPALRRGLLRLARFVRDRRGFIRGLVRDLSRDDPEAASFVQTNLPRHGVILAGLVKRCQAEGSIVELPLPAVMAVAMSVVNVPSITAEPMAAMMAKFSPHGFPGRKAVEDALLTDEALEQRVDLALKALKP